MAVWDSPESNAAIPQNKVNLYQILITSKPAINLTRLQSAHGY